MYEFSHFADPHHYKGIILISALLCVAFALLHFSNCFLAIIAQTHTHTQAD